MDHIPNIAQVHKAIETKYPDQEHKHVGDSGAWTRGLVIPSLALFHWTTHALTLSQVEQLLSDIAKSPNVLQDISNTVPNVSNQTHQPSTCMVNIYNK